MLLAGLNVIADVDRHMIEAMTRLIAVIQGRVKEGKTVEETRVGYFNIGNTKDDDDEDDEEKGAEADDNG